MVRYKCGRCGNIQDYDTACSRCQWYDGMMQMVQDARQNATQMNIAIYGDGGCCGCNRKKRRIMMFVIAAVFGLVAIYFAIFGDNDQRTQYAASCGAGAGLFLIAGVCCPDGCCGEYRRNNNYYQPA